jgi:hypothetical protein
VDRHRTGGDPEEAARVLRVVAQGGAKLALLGCQRFERRQAAVQLVEWTSRLVAPPLVFGERGLERKSARQPLVDRLAQQLGVAKGVRDALQEIRIFVVAGVAYQRPAVTVRPAVRAGGSTPPASSTLRVGDGCRAGVLHGRPAATA